MLQFLIIDFNVSFSYLYLRLSIKKKKKKEKNSSFNKYVLEFKRSD